MQWCIKTTPEIVNVKSIKETKNRLGLHCALVYQRNYYRGDDFYGNIFIASVYTLLCQRRKYKISLKLWGYKQKHNKKKAIIHQENNSIKCPNFRNCCMLLGNPCTCNIISHFTLSSLRSSSALHNVAVNLRHFCERYFPVHPPGTNTFQWHMDCW